MSLYDNAIFCCSISQIPPDKHYAIVKSSSIYVPGDERSQTNPGHGYPAENKPIVEYEAYLNEADWKSAINKLVTSRYSKEFKAFIVNPVEIKTNIEIKEVKNV